MGKKSFWIAGPPMFSDLGKSTSCFNMQFASGKQHCILCFCINEIFNELAPKAEILSKIWEGLLQQCGLVGI